MEAVGPRCRPSTRRSSPPALQLDCPDLAMARHTGFQDLDDGQFLLPPVRRVLNHATRNIDPASMRMHLCWGQLRRTARPRHRARRRAAARARRSARRRSCSRPPTRHAHEWQVWAPRGPRRQGARARRDHLDLELRRAPGACRRAAVALHRHRRGRPSDRRHRLWVRHVRGVGKVDPAVAYKKLASLVAGAELVSRR